MSRRAQPVAPATAREYLEALTAVVARLETKGIKILEARFEQPDWWCLAVQKEEARLEVCYERDDGSFSISRFRSSKANVEYWEKPELIPAAKDPSSLAQLLDRAEREILSRLKNAEPAAPTNVRAGGGRGSS